MFKNMSRHLKLDIIERAAWTFAQVAVGIIITHQANWPAQYATVIALVLSIAKGLIARHFGNPDTAATLPASVDTPQQ